VDLTLEMFNHIAFTFLGLGLLAASHRTSSVFGWALAGSLAVVGVLAAFVMAQRFGLFRLVEGAPLRLAVRQHWETLGSLSGLHKRRPNSTGRPVGSSLQAVATSSLGCSAASRLWRRCMWSVSTPLWAIH
jgi:hypothetical protein